MQLEADIDKVQQAENECMVSYSSLYKLYCSIFKMVG